MVEGFMRRCFHKWHMGYHYLFLITSSFGASGRLHFVIVFPGYCVIGGQTGAIFTQTPISDVFIERFLIIRLGRIFRFNLAVDFITVLGIT